MSLWKTISASPELQQRMIQYYNEKGLLDLRIHFAQWIEERITSEHFTKAPIEQYKQLASKFYEDLQQKLISAANDNSMKFKINSIGNYIAQTSALDIYTHIRQGVFQEVQMLEPMSQNPYFIPGIAPNMGPGAMIPSPHDHSGFSRHPPEEFIHIHQSITLLLADLEPFRAKLFSLRNDYEDYRNRWNEFHAQATNAELQMEMDHRKRNILANKNELDLNARDLFRRYDPIQNAVIDELKKWQRQQALAGNGASFTENNLDQIQRCIELLVDIICKLLMYIAELARILESAELTELIRSVRSAQRVLYCSAFVVEKQPPQVMKTNTRFAAAVRWLIGGQLNINLNSPTVECVILSEAQAHRQFVQRNHDGLPSGTAPPHSGEIHNNTCVMEFNHQTRVFSASFRNMQLKKIKRAEKKGTESVMDEKFALLFYTSTIVDDCQLRVWTLSLPVVVIVHGNQEPQSWATITWDNAFAEIVREPFHVPDKVSWNQLALALSMKFASATGRGLTQENLVFLYEKLFRSDNVNSDHKEFISWAQFCKEPLPDRAFTFWEWFFAIMKLTKDHLLGIWKKELVVGFISKYNTDVKLRSNPTPGSFLLRFSDSELGGISVAFINEDNNTVNLAPWVARDLHIRGLADRIQDLHMLRCVYPGYINRDDAFSEFYTQRTEASVRDGYVPSTIVAAVPSLSNENSFMQSPQRADIPMNNDHFNIDLERLLY